MRNIRMKLKRIKFYFLIVLTLTVFSCLKTGLSSKSDTDNGKKKRILANFSHAIHESIFTKEKVVCSNCHYLQFSLKGLNKKANKKFSKRLTYPGMEECHWCHNNAQKANIASQKCILCHSQTDLLIPDNHKVDWLYRHRNISRIDKKECSNCHRDEFCSDCHLRRDDIRQRVHDRNYIFSHSIEVRTNPRKCVTCHTLEYCKECHTERGITQ